MPDFFVQVDIEVAKGWNNSAYVLVEQGDKLGAEAALRAVRIALHKEHDRVLVDEFGETLLKGLPDAVSGDLRC